MSKLYKVEALEKFLVRTTYYVEANSPTEARKKCKHGEVAYDSHQVEEGEEEWIGVVACEVVPQEDIPQEDIPCEPQ